MYKTVSDAVSTVLDLKRLVANANHCEGEFLTGEELPGIAALNDRV